MENMDSVMKEFDEVGEQILNGDYDDSQEIVARYKALKKQLEDAGVKILDGINFDNLIL